MITIHANNVNDSYAEGMTVLANRHEVVESRAGTVYRYPTPVTTIYEKPWQRVLFNQVRDCNPFFHLQEAIWMLAGQQDVESLAQYNKRMAEYSDDGLVFNAPYGYRLRRHFGYDQIVEASRLLRDFPNSRQVVLSIWDPRYGGDLHKNTKDVPCNDTLKFDVREGKVNMYLFNRSNDIIWGCYGANAVHFSIIHEVVASLAGYPQGRYYQISTDFHAYQEVFDKKFVSVTDQSPVTNFDSTVALVSDPDSFLRECEEYWKGGDCGFNNTWLTMTAAPMREAWNLWKKGDKVGAWYEASDIEAPDWRRACQEWMERRGFNPQEAEVY